MPDSHPTTTLDKAPIIEAVVELSVHLPPGFNLEAAADGMAARLTSGYPSRRKLWAHAARMAFTDEGQATVTSSGGLMGFGFWSADQKQVVQIKTTGFCFNRLAPYECLDRYLPELKRRWEEYCELALPVLIHRIALRYINQINLPFESDGSVNLDRYLRDAPRLLNAEDFTMSGFLHQHELVEKSSQRRARLLMTSQQANSKVLSLIFDIEAFEESLSLSPTDSALWSTLDALRRLKNRLFFHNLTSECLNLFQS